LKRKGSKRCNAFLVTQSANSGLFSPSSANVSTRLYHLVASSDFLRFGVVHGLRNVGRLLFNRHNHVHRLVVQSLGRVVIANLLQSVPVGEGGAPKVRGEGLCFDSVWKLSQRDSWYVILQSRSQSLKTSLSFFSQSTHRITAS